MELVEFKDACVISRDIGEYDDYDNPVRKIIYDGPCLYEERGQSYSDRMTVRSPLIFLPSNDATVEADDIVAVTTFKGRKINGLTEKVRDISMKFRKEEITRIEIKQGATRDGRLDGAQ